MMINNEGLRLEAETLSGLMVQLAENEIDSDSFAVMSDLGENGQEHDCDLPITETALRASAVIEQLLAVLEEKDLQLDAEVRAWTQKYVNESARAKSAEQREEHLKATVDVLSAKNADLERRLATLPADWLKDSSLETWFPLSAARLARLEQRLQQPIKLPPKIDESNVPFAAMGANAFRSEVVTSLQKQGFKVEGE